MALLPQYLLDPQNRSQSGRFHAALALDDLFQCGGLARASDSTSVCRILINNFWKINERRCEPELIREAMSLISNAHQNPHSVIASM